MAIQQQPQKTQLQLKNGFDLACASEMEVDLTGHQFSPGPASEVDTATAVLVEQALTTVDTAHVVNKKMERPQVVRSMVAEMFSAQLGVSARQFTFTMSAAAAALREAMVPLGINQIDSSSPASPLRYLSALDETQLRNLSIALVARSEANESDLTPMREHNKTHLDLTAVSAAPSQGVASKWIEDDAAIRESVARFANAPNGAKDNAVLMTDKGGKDHNKKQNVCSFYWDEEKQVVETYPLTSLETGAAAQRKICHHSSMP